MSSSLMSSEWFAYLEACLLYRITTAAATIAIIKTTTPTATGTMILAEILIFFYYITWSQSGDINKILLPGMQRFGKM